MLSGRRGDKHLCIPLKTNVEILRFAQDDIVGRLFQQP
jgi:hypothetical protein